MESPHALQRGLFNTICVLMIFVAFWRSCGGSGSTATATRVPAPTGYEQRFCDDADVADYTHRNPEHITIALKDGCFGNHTKLPLAWQNAFVQKSQKPGDWAAVWCAGQNVPSQPRLESQDMGNMFANCKESGERTGDFYLEGRGTITFRRTQQNPEYAALANSPGNDGTAVGATGQSPLTEAPPPEKQYSITPIAPDGGDRPDYTFVLKQCYRSGDLIKCWGMMTNTTDAPRYTNLHDSLAVDDEGNSILIGTFGGGFMFPGADSPYGIQQKLLPGVPTKFEVTIQDAHRNVKTVNLELHVNGGQPYRSDSLILKAVPVQ